MIWLDEQKEHFSEERTCMKTELGLSNTPGSSVFIRGEFFGGNLCPAGEW
jgi:hypothetical protein